MPRRLKIRRSEHSEGIKMQDAQIVENAVNSSVIASLKK